jgi:hypothetical protein
MQHNNDTKQSRIDDLNSIIKAEDLETLRIFSFQSQGFLTNSMRSKAWDLLLRIKNYTDEGLVDRELDSDFLRQLEVDIERSFNDVGLSEEEIINHRAMLHRTMVYLFQKFRW